MTIKKLITVKKLSKGYPQAVDNSCSENLKAVLDLIFGPNKNIDKAKAIFFSELDRANVKGEIYKLANTIFNCIDICMDESSKHSDKNLSDKDKQLLAGLDSVGDTVKIEPIKEDAKSRLIRLLGGNTKEGKVLGDFALADYLYITEHWDEAKTMPGFIKFTGGRIDTVVQDVLPDPSAIYVIVADGEDIPRKFLKSPGEDSASASTNSRITRTCDGSLVHNVFVDDGTMMDVVIDWPSGTVFIDNTNELFNYIDFGGIATCLSNIAYDDKGDDSVVGAFQFMGYRYANSDTVRYPASISELCDSGSRKPIALVFKFIKDPRV